MYIKKKKKTEWWRGCEVQVFSKEKDTIKSPIFDYHQEGNLYLKSLSSSFKPEMFFPT